MRNKSKKNAFFEQIPFSDIVFGAMLAAVVGIMPLIVRLAVRFYPPELARFVGQQYADFFAYVKGWFLGVPAVVIVFYFVSELVTSGDARVKIDFKAIIKNPVVIASAVFLLFTLLSAILSDFPFTSLHGTKDRGEGILIWLAYFTVFIAAMYYVRDPKFAKPILWGLLFSSIVMGAIGISQFLGRCFFGTTLAAWLVTGDTHPLRLVFTIAHGTLYNPNTFGMYSAMVAPILLLAGFTYRGKRFVNALLLLGGVLMLFSIFGSASLGGMIGLLAAVGVLLVVSIPSIVKFSSIRMWLMVALALAVLVLSFLFVPFLNVRAVHLLNRLETTVGAGNIRTEDLLIEGNTLYVKNSGETVYSITIEVDMYPAAPTPLGMAAAEWITVRDATGLPIPPAGRFHAPIEDSEIVQYAYIFEIPGRASITLLHRENHFIYRNIMMLTMNGQIMGVCGLTGHLIDLMYPVPAWGFYRREYWGSGRGFIFSRTFPMMPERFFIGSGPDTYVNVFPNHDRFGLLSSGMPGYNFVDKAHNLYLQTWITKGGIATLALIFLLGYYMLTTLISLMRTKGEAVFTYGLRLGLLAGVSAFAVASLATDSTIGSSGVLFVLLGTGYGLNMWVKAQRR
ncbi:MAG: O-antigen ligase family protein [Defluviitaleaceae bacterium]|nr:O-antigen ligase family protein [Defluviitaleaceae bacterium]MCL2238458.1 O-antigen ligase family protein [Defluviitaleaceae bacterium]